MEAFFPKKPTFAPKPLQTGFPPSMRNRFLWLTLLFLLCYIPLFLQLEKPALELWDEALYANNALEMAVGKDFLAPYD